MRLRVKSIIDLVILELFAVALSVVILGGTIYYYGSMYGARAEVAHLMRVPSSF